MANLGGSFRYRRSGSGRCQTFFIVRKSLLLACSPDSSTKAQQRTAIVFGITPAIGGRNIYDTAPVTS